MEKSKWTLFDIAGAIISVSALLWADATIWAVVIEEITGKSCFLLSELNANLVLFVGVLFALTSQKFLKLMEWLISR